MIELLNSLFRTKQTQPSILDRMGIDFHSLFAGGILFIGQTGSGKSSAMRPLIRELLPFVACIYACVKADEIAAAAQRFAQAGRTPHFLSKIKCNVLAYLLAAPGGSPMEVARYFDRLNQILNASKGGGDGDSSFWDNLFNRTMIFAITIVAYGKRDLSDTSKLITTATLNDIQEFVAQAPNSVSFYQAENYEQTEIGKLLRQASSNAKSNDERRMVSQAIAFWVKEWTALSEKAVSAASTQISGILSPLLMPPFFDVFSSEESNFTPDDIVYGGKSLILDWPVLVWGDSGKLAQNLCLQMTRACLLRRGQQYPPVLFVQDECQLLLCPDYDCEFFTVSRSAGAITILATQSLSVLTTTFGGDMRAKEQCTSIINCMGTHVVLGTNDAEGTAKFYSTLWGEHRELFHSFSENRSEDSDDMLGAIFGGRLNVHNNQQMRPRVTVDRLTRMRNGCPAHGHIIDAFVTQPGRIFEDTGLPYRMVTFSSKE